METKEKEELIEGIQEEIERLIYEEPKCDFEHIWNQAIVSASDCCNGYSQEEIQEEQENNANVFIKEINGDLHFCKIVLVGETKLCVDNHAPKQRAGTRDYIDWLRIIELKEERSKEWFAKNVKKIFLKER